MCFSSIHIKFLLNKNSTIFDYKQLQIVDEELGGH